MAIQVAPADRVCAKDSDCVHVATQCSCSCGDAVNKAQLQKYSDLGKSLCRNYNGQMCKMLCKGEVKCLEEQCHYAERVH